MRKKKPQLDEEDAYYEGDDVAGAQLPPRLVVGGTGDEDDIDPLEAYMREIQAEAHQEMVVSHAKAVSLATSGLGKRVPLPHQQAPQTQFAEDDEGELYSDGEDITEDLLKVKARQAALQSANPKDQFAEALNDQGKIDSKALKAQQRLNGFEELAPVDTNKEYGAFEKNLYHEHPDVAGMSPEEVENIRKELQIALFGAQQKNPVLSFEKMGLPQLFLEEIQHFGLLKPTPIQSQAVPLILSGLDVVGIAETGSGKTYAYVWPLLVHISRQPPAKLKEGPAGLILCPTRELGTQILKELKKFGKLLGVRSVSILGGEDKKTQWKELLKGVDIVVGTPGRIIDLCRKRGVKMDRVTFMVIDEADRLFGMGFEKQIKSIIGQVRPNRQLALFSATFNTKVRDLTEQYLVNPVQIVIGKKTAASTIKQEVVLMDTPEEKMEWLLNNLVQMIIHGYVLIFVSTIQQTAMLDQVLAEFLPEIPRGVLHGTMMQHERAIVLAKFKKFGMILIATDVASRGLDVPAIKFVINFEPPKDQDAYIHRVGRTGRGGREGVAITLLLRSDKRPARFISTILQRAGESVPEDLRLVAGGLESESESQKHSDESDTEVAVGDKKVKNQDASSKLLRKALASGQRTKKGLGYRRTGKQKKQPEPLLQEEEDGQNQFHHGQEFKHMLDSLRQKEIQLQRDRLLGIGPKELTIQKRVTGFRDATDPEAELSKEFEVVKVSEDEYNKRQLDDFRFKLKDELKQKFRGQFVAGGLLKGNHKTPEQ